MKTSLRLMVTVLVMWVCQSGMVAANEVAMISNVTGSVSASLDGKSWEPTTAETLNDGTVLEVHPGASLSIIHLLNQSEYTAATPQQLAVSAAGINGAKTEVLALAGIPKDLEIKSSQTEDAGASDKSQTGSAETKKKEIQNGNQFRQQAAPSLDLSDKFDDLTSAQSQSKDREINNLPSKPSSSEEQLEVVGTPGANSFQSSGLSKGARAPSPSAEKHAVIIALPDLYEPVGASIVLLSEDQQLHGRWRLYSLSSANPTSQEISLQVKVDGNDPRSGTVSFASGKYTGTVIGGILQLEGKKNLELAAAKWLELLRDPKYNRDVVEKHLNRLAQKLREKWVQ